MAATIDIRVVEKELRRIAKVSDGVKKQLHRTLAEIEQDPSQFDTLEAVEIPLPANTCLRKAKIQHRKHSFRLIFAHHRLGDRDHVDVLMAFPRKQGYDIDWSWVAGAVVRD